MNSDLYLKENMEKEELKEHQIKELKNLNSIKLLNEDIDVDEHLVHTEEELKKIGHSLGQRMFIDAVINILDKLMEKGKSFNRLIFLYLVEISRLNKDSHIQL
jgi:hypothetical protein